MQGRVLGDGRYELIEELGRGGMATVWRALDHRLGVPRAVKVLKPHLSDGRSNARARMEREARLMASLEHPHVAQVHDVGEDEGSVWIVMSLLDGGSIHDHIAAYGAMPPRQAVTVTLAVLEALSSAHERGVIHRDVKPHNVLVDVHGAPRLADFGIARVGAVDAFTRTGAVMGTWAFMAPEQRQSAKDADPRSDVYSAGALLATLLTANEPFDLHNPQSHDRQLGTVHPRLRDVIARMCAYRPDDRFDSAQQVADALRGLLPTLPEDPAGTPALGTAPTSDAARSRSTLPSDSTGPPYTPASSTSAMPLLAAVSVAAVLGVLGVGAVGAGVWLMWDLGEPPAQTAVRAVEEPSLSPEPEPTAVEEASQARPEPSLVVPEPRAVVVPPPRQPVVQAPEPEPEPVQEPEPAPEMPQEPPPMGTLKIIATVSTPVEVDGTPVGSTPLMHPVAEGEHEVRLLPTGAPAVVRRLEVAEGQTREFCWDVKVDQPCSR
ncbi:MAG: protein kinase [Myxococcales bacterium]|nr:protein kinase [Myxococcales bacterium]